MYNIVERLADALECQARILKLDGHIAVAADAKREADHLRLIAILEA